MNNEIINVPVLILTIQLLILLWVGCQGVVLGRVEKKIKKLLEKTNEKTQHNQRKA